VSGFMINNAQYKHNIPLEIVTVHNDSTMKHKADEVLEIKSYYHFIKAVNYYLVANNFQNGMFIKDNCKGFEEYKEKLLKENFVELVEKSGVPYMDKIVEFAKEYNKQLNAILVFSEKELSSNTCVELFNLAKITGKLGKISSGLISLKEKNNSQGLFDMGICPTFGVGIQPIKDKRFIAKLKKKWNTKKLPLTINVSQYDSLEKGILKNIFIFGEDPLGCVKNKVQIAGWLAIVDFVVVQDYFMTETAKQSDLILPGSLPLESGGSFTNTQQVIQEFDKQFISKVERLSYLQIVDLLKKLGSKEKSDLHDIRMEALSLLPTEISANKYQFVFTNIDNNNRIFEYGCDCVNERFEKEFEEAFYVNNS